MFRLVGVDPMRLLVNTIFVLLLVATSFRLAHAENSFDDFQFSVSKHCNSYWWDAEKYEQYLVNFKKYGTNPEGYPNIYVLCFKPSPNNKPQIKSGTITISNDDPNTLLVISDMNIKGEHDSAVVNITGSNIIILGLKTEGNKGVNIEADNVKLIKPKITAADQGILILGDNVILENGSITAKKGIDVDGNNASITGMKITVEVMGLDVLNRDAKTAGIVGNTLNGNGTSESTGILAKTGIYTSENNIGNFAYPIKYYGESNAKTLHVIKDYSGKIKQGKNLFSVIGKVDEAACDIGDNSFELYEDDINSETGYDNYTFHGKCAVSKADQNYLLDNFNTINEGECTLKCADMSLDETYIFFDGAGNFMESTKLHPFELPTIVTEEALAKIKDTTIDNFQFDPQKHCIYQTTLSEFQLFKPYYNSNIYIACFKNGVADYTDKTIEFTNNNPRELLIIHNLSLNGSISPLVRLSGSNIILNHANLKAPGTIVEIAGASYNIVVTDSTFTHDGSEPDGIANLVKGNSSTDISNNKYYNFFDTYPVKYDNGYYARPLDMSKEYSAKVKNEDDSFYIIGKTNEALCGDGSSAVDLYEDNLDSETGYHDYLFHGECDLLNAGQDYLLDSFKTINKGDCVFKCDGVDGGKAYVLLNNGGKFSTATQLQPWKLPNVVTEEELLKIKETTIGDFQLDPEDYCAYKLTDPLMWDVPFEEMLENYKNYANQPFFNPDIYILCFDGNPIYIYEPLTIINKDPNSLLVIYNLSLKMEHGFGNNDKTYPLLTLAGNNITITDSTIVGEDDNTTNTGSIGLMLIGENHSVISSSISKFSTGIQVGNIEESATNTSIKGPDTYITNVHMGIFLSNETKTNIKDVQILTDYSGINVYPTFLFDTNFIGKKCDDGKTKTIYKHKTAMEICDNEYPWYLVKTLVGKAPIGLQECKGTVEIYEVGIDSSTKLPFKKTSASCPLQNKWDEPLIFQNNKAEVKTISEDECAFSCEFPGNGLSMEMPIYSMFENKDSLFHNTNDTGKTIITSALSLCGALCLGDPSNYGTPVAAIPTPTALEDDEASSAYDTTDIGLEPTVDDTTDYDDYEEAPPEDSGNSIASLIDPFQASGGCANIGGRKGSSGMSPCWPIIIVLLIILKHYYLRVRQ